MPYVKRPWSEKALDWLFPPQCPGCGRCYYGLCPACLREVRPFRSLCGWLEVNVGGLYKGALRQAVVSFKAGGQLYLKYALADLMLQALDQCADLSSGRPGCVYLVTVPPDPARLRKRGYSCPRLLAEQVWRGWQELASCGCLPQRLLKVTLEPAYDCLLLNPGEHREQKGLARLERQLNVRAAFSVSSEWHRRARNGRFLLLDDVMTTGATLREASLSLFQAGAAAVEGLVLAAVPGDGLED